MKLTDVNLLLYAVDASSPVHPVSRAWLETQLSCATVVVPGDRHLALVRELLRPLGTAGNLVSDAHLAALAIEHGAELCSADTDFARFQRLRWINPLATP